VQPQEPEYLSSEVQCQTGTLVSTPCFPSLASLPNHGLYGVQALFVGRAVVDEVLPPAFLVSALKALPDGCLGVAVVQAAGTPRTRPAHRAALPADSARS
jgi:hypothetical protein